jgi:hypothetical protein
VTAYAVFLHELQQKLLGNKDSENFADHAYF